MPRTIAYWAMTAATAAVLLWASWPGAAHNPATLISRVDVVAAVLILLGLPRAVRRRFGPVGSGRMPWLVRGGGYAIVIALILVKADVEQFELAPRRSGTQLASQLSGTRLAGVWFGEVVFLLVIAAYIAALLSVTARRPPASPATLAIGTGAGVALGVVVYALRPLINYTPVAWGWLGALFGVAKIAAVFLVLYAAIKAAIVAARRSSRRDSQRQQINARAQVGFAAGLCVGISAAVLVSVLGISTIALAPATAREHPVDAAGQSDVAWSGYLARAERSIQLRSGLQLGRCRLPSCSHHLPAAGRRAWCLGRALRGRRLRSSARRRGRRRGPGGSRSRADTSRRQARDAGRPGPFAARPRRPGRRLG